MIANKRKKFLSVLLILLTGITLTSCQYREAASKKKIAVITKSTSSAFWKSAFTGANAAATEYNLTLSIMGPDYEEDYATQNAMIRDAVEEGVGAIVFSAVDFNANAEAIDEAASKGVKIVVIDSDVNSGLVHSRIGTDNYEAGKMAGVEALKCTDQVLNIGIVNYDINSANGQQREQGFRETVSLDKRVNIIKTINVLSTTEDAKTGALELLKEHPEINVIATFNEWTSLGVGWAIRTLELAEETTVVAFDSNVVSVGMLETGEVDALIVQNPYAMGYLGVEKAYHLLNEQRVESVISTSCSVVTRDNMFDADCQRMLFAFD